MRIREENCNMVLLATVTLVSTIIAASVALLGPAPARQDTVSQPAYVTDSTQVRVVGARFVPNTNPRERH
jgi:hypothetical protein